MARIKIGDIYKVLTPYGNAYLHYFYKDEKYGPLIRVMPGRYKADPASMNTFIASNEDYIAYVDLAGLVKNKPVEKIGFYSVEGYEKPKYMKELDENKWVIIEVATLFRRSVKVLSKEEEALSPWGLHGYEYFFDMLIENWSLENWNLEKWD